MTDRIAARNEESIIVFGSPGGKSQVYALSNRRTIIILQINSLRPCEPTTYSPINKEKIKNLTRVWKYLLNLSIIVKLFLT